MFDKYLCAILICLPLNALFSQNILITYQKSDTLFVCGTDTFFVEVKNTGATPLNNALLKVSLPTGIVYLPGSVSGAAEQNISDVQQPIFSLPGLPGGATAAVAIIIAADCIAADVLDEGQLFVAGISVESAAGNAQVTTTSLEVETGLLLIESVEDEIMSGEKGDTLFRKICVKNTRLGKISALFLEDEHLKGFDVFVPNASATTGTPTFFGAEFNSGIFTSTGNGDTWLDLNEQVCLTERIIITDCGFPEYNSSSVLRVGWGCGGEICRYDSLPAAIMIKESTRVPKLHFSPVWNTPTDNCGNTPAVTGLKIVNTGKVAAANVYVGLAVIDSTSGFGMGNNSFRIAGSNGTTALPVALSQAGLLTSCGLPVLNKATLSIPFVGAGDSILLLFDTYTCRASCDQSLPLYSVEYFYTKPCPVNGFVSDTLFIAPDGAYLVGSFIGNSIGACLQSSQTYPFQYQLVTKRLIEDNGFIHLNLDLPLGLSFNDSCGALLGGTAPVLSQTIPLPGGGFQVHLAWKLPLPNDSLDMDFCLRYDCDTNMVCKDDLPLPNNGIVIYSSDCPISCFLQAGSQSYWTPLLNTPYECAIGDCDSLRLAVSRACFTSTGINTDTIGNIDTIFPLPGFKKWFDVYRVNYGYRDNNDNRHADALQSADLQLVRRDRFLPGDTLRVEYCGTVDSGGSLVRFGRSIWEEVVRSDMGGAAGNDFFNTAAAQNTFVNAGLFRFLQDSLKIRYADGSVYTCLLDDLIFNDDKNYYTVNQVNTWPPDQLDDLVSQKYRFQFSLETLHQSGCLPKGTLDLGDSIFIYTDFRFDLNFRPASGNTPDPPLVGFRIALSAGGPPHAYNAQPFRKLQYSGFRTAKSPNTFSIKSCEPSAEIKPFRYSLRIARENLFPFEIRPLARISNYRQTVPAGITAASAKVDFLVLQDSIPFLNNLPLPFNQSPGFLNVDFGPAFAEPVDEGFTLQSNIVFQPDCLYDEPDSSRQYFNVNYQGRLNGGINTVSDSVINAIGFYSNTPGLEFLSGDSIITTPNSTFEVNFSLKNNTTPPAFNTWFYLTSKNAQVTDLKLFQLPQNQPFIAQNGVFKTGTLNSLVQRSFRLTGVNTSCETDTLLLVYGWNCAPIDSPEQYSCGRDSVWIEFRIERPELELEVLYEPPFIPICDTSGYFEFKIYNAKSGFAFDPFATVKLPPGLSIVPGSAQISYPAGSVYTDISDPDLLPGNQFQWKIAGLLADISANGLPGVGTDSSNTFLIRFRVTAECGFVSNTPIIYGTRGREACGRSTNILNKPGDILKVNGLNPSYGVQADLQPLGSDPLYCGSVQPFYAKLTFSGTPSPGDSIYINLPPGITYVPDSYVPQQNAPAGPPDLAGQIIRLPIPSGLVAGSILEFLFSITANEAAGCIDQSLILQTRVRSEAFCETIGAPCAVYVATGEAIWNLSLLHPELSLTGADAQVSDGATNITIAANNIGVLPAPGASVQIWYDADGNGIISSADSLLGTLSHDQAINPGSGISLSALLNIDPGFLCNLLIVLPAAENCACSDKVLPLQKVALNEDKLEFCSIMPVPVGVPAQPGFSYQWITPAGIACDTCPISGFIPAASTLPGQPVVLVLEEKSAACTVQHRFELVFGAVAFVQAGDTAGCKGSPFELSAFPAGASYQWTGQGIDNPALQVQTVSPDSTSEYSVIITFANNCKDTLSKIITVFQPDSTVLPPRTTCQGEPVNVPGGNTDIPGLYYVVLKNARLCDSVVLQVLDVLPDVKTEEELSFCAGDTLPVFDTILTQSGQICRSFKSVNGCDSLHCFTATVLPLPPVADPDTIVASPGETILLDGPGGYNDYTWFPADTACQHCENISVLPDSSGYHEYQLLVTDANGCEAMITYRVVVLIPCDPKRLRIPNAFTPNGDKVNDVFRVVPFEGSELVGSLTIYDRWGEKLYEENGNVSWDGTKDGRPCPSDVYVYRIDIICDGKPKAVWGDVTLLR
ncbi:MAG: gliding motility-associated C-terminal domain-containing protein [Lewinellaceae bacterium]|nr:gliding motility-associated C-terminal domain-containing protein [Lewinellaceae bacterium]